MQSTYVVAAHECKSAPPFPELLVSYLGMVLLAHPWFDPATPLASVADYGEHLAPTLFIGGAGTLWRQRMVEALEEHFPVNIFLNLHASRFHRFSSVLKRITLPGDA
ncbi:MAG TPA: hypothetical protein VFS60_19460 [Thermoanaerobaculia bacterium]|nr:hypothetical protein [Thermoanaerobaculia bacterium]